MGIIANNRALINPVCIVSGGFYLSKSNQGRNAIFIKANIVMLTIHFYIAYTTIFIYGMLKLSPMRSFQVDL